MVTLKINSREVSVPQGTPILEAAKGIGVEIPYFCYHPKLSIVGSCRLCLVEVGGKLITSCSTPVSDGMDVRTDTENVKKARGDILALYLINHPLDCPICDKGGECPLQDYTYNYGPAESMFKEEKWHFEKPVDLSRYIVLDRERCVLCTRCVRFQEEIALHPELGVYPRGRASMIGTHPGKGFTSNFSGNTIELCPVGALTSRLYRFRARPWDIKREASICPTCSCGCNIWIDTRTGKVERLLARENPDVDEGWLCDRGRFNYRFLSGERRLNRPLIRVDGRLCPVTWEDAIDYTAKAFKGIVDRYGPDSVAGLASPDATNEDSYAFQRLLRTAIGTNNIDRIGGEGVVELTIGKAYDRGIKRFTLRGIEGADLIVLLGGNPSEEQPILDLWLKKAATKHKSRLLVISPQDIELKTLAERFMTYKGGSEGAVLNALSEALNGRGNELSWIVSFFEDAKSILFLIGTKGLKEKSINPFIEAVVKNLKGKDLTIAGLVLYANSNGVCDMGILPDYLPGYRAVGDKETEKVFESLWGKKPPKGRGLDFRGILEAAGERRVKAVYMMDSSPLESGANNLGEMIKGIDFFVFQGHTFKDIAEHATVVLPQKAFSEVEGTFTNIERRVQRLNRASKPIGSILEGWRILSMLSRAMDYDMGFEGVEDVMEDIKVVIPSYALSGYPEIGDKGALVDVS